jgi:hypothetical protein
VNRRRFQLERLAFGSFGWPSLMERSTWQLLEAKGVLTCPIGEANDDSIFQDAYAWMNGSMASAGILAPAPGLSPWWCWVRREANHPEPYIEDTEGLHDPVVLELSVPSNKLCCRVSTFGILYSTSATSGRRSLMRKILIELRRVQRRDPTLQRSFNCGCRNRDQRCLSWINVLWIWAHLKLRASRDVFGF